MNDLLLLNYRLHIRVEGCLGDLDQRLLIEVCGHDMGDLDQRLLIVRECGLLSYSEMAITHYTHCICLLDFHTFYAYSIEILEVALVSIL